MVLELVVYIRFLLGLRGKCLGFGFFVREKGKVNLLGGCFFVEGNNVISFYVCENW